MIPRNLHRRLVPDCIREEIKNIFFENHAGHSFIKVGKRKWAKFDTEHGFYWHVIVSGDIMEPGVKVICHGADGLVGVMYDVLSDVEQGLLITDVNSDGVEEATWSHIALSSDGGAYLYDVGQYAMDQGR